MKPRSNQNSPAQTAAAPAQATRYAPSVPISIYRELAAELDATRALLETVHAENQQLQQQNYQLRQEIDRLVQSALNLRSYTEFNPVKSPVSIPEPHPETAAAPIPTPIEAFSEADEFESVAAQLRGNAIAESPIASQVSEEEIAAPPAEAVIVSTEVADLPLSLTLESKPKGLSGLWLTLTVIAIVISAFGAGFFLVKPLLQNR